MMKNFYKRNTCRLCNSKDMKVVLPLNKSPLCDAYVKRRKKQQFYDLNLCFCKKCKFVQIDTVVNPEIIYRDYIYVTASSSGLEKHFKKYANDVCKFLKFKNSKLVVDIGGNDGILLNYFKKRKHNTINIEPSFIAARKSEKKGIKTLNEFFDQEIANKIFQNYGSVDLITINNLFANIDDLNDFTKCLNSLLSKDGVLVIESSYLLDMIKNMVFDFIYHEHLSYFSIIPLTLFFKKFGMRLIKVEKVNTKGGSLRYYWTREDSKWKEHNSVSKFKKLEKKFNISKSIFDSFNKKIELNKKNITNYLSRYKKSKIVAYGASATSTTLISHFKLFNFIDYLVDDNPGKINTFSPGYHIPVYNSKKIATDKPNVIIILAWRYKKEILKKLKKNYYKNKNIVVPLPKFNM